MSHPEKYPDPHNDINANTVFGFWIYLMTDFILFATLFATYAVLEKGTFGGPTAKQLFHLPYVLVETLLLLGSSFTCGLATLHIEKNNIRKLSGWYGATFALGLAFLLMVGAEFVQLINEGHTWDKSAFLSAYFTLIGTHAIHIFFGLLFIPVFIGDVLRRGLIPVTIRRLTCLKLFWFFSYIVWIFMFTFVYLMGVSSNG